MCSFLCRLVFHLHLVPLTPLPGWRTALTENGGTLQGGAGTKSYHKLSMDHTKCKNAVHPGANLAEWVPGT